MDTSIILSEEEFKTFHKIDRELYVRLVTTINREPIESMQIMSFWLWLEQLGFPNIIFKMLSLSDEVVQVIAEEAIRCINCLALFALPVHTNTDIPMTRKLLERPISLRLIHDIRDLAIMGIAKILNEVCLRALCDIAQEAMAKVAKESVPLGNVTGGGSGSDKDQDHQGSGVTVGNTIMYPAPLLGPGLVRPVYQQHPSIRPSSSTLFVGGSVLGQHPSHQGDVGSHLNPQAVPYNSTAPTPTGTGVVPQNERTMFVTFSRGYTVTEEELFEFFNKMHGNCIEEVHFEEVLPHEQSMYARVVFYSSLKISEILDGKDRIHFVINGKQLRARRYQVKQGRRR